MNGAAARGLEHLVDLDYGFTPATNVLQLSRIALKPGQKAEVPVAWFDLDSRSLTELPQYYERRGEASYWYEAPTVPYRALLEIAPVASFKSYPKSLAARGVSEGAVRSRQRRQPLHQKRARGGVRLKPDREMIGAARFLDLARFRAQIGSRDPIGLESGEPALCPTWSSSFNPAAAPRACATAAARLTATTGDAVKANSAS